MSVYHDPDALALLFVQQYLNEQGYQAGEVLCPARHPLG
jgi:hypothetical protein